MNIVKPNRIVKSTMNRIKRASLISIFPLCTLLLVMTTPEAKAAGETCESHPGWKVSMNKHTTKWICSYNKRASCPSGYVLIRKPTGAVRPWQCKYSRRTTAARCPANTTFMSLTGKCLGSRVLGCGSSRHLPTYFGFRPTESFDFGRVITRSNNTKGYDITAPIAICGSYGNTPRCPAGYKYKKMPRVYNSLLTTDFVDRCTKKKTPFTYPKCSNSSHIIIETGKDVCVNNFHEAVW